MDSEIIWIILIFIILPLVEKIFRKGQEKERERRDLEHEPESLEAGAPWEAGGATGQRNSHKSELERLIAEELGLDLPEPAEPAEASPTPRPPTRKPPGDVSSPYTRLPRSASGAPQPRSKVVYPQSRIESRPRRPEPAETLEVPPERSLDAQAINLDERAIRESRAPVSERERGLELAKKKAPEVARVGIPIGRSRRARTRERRAGPGLPSSPEWSNVKKAIVWSEILGPPKALRD